MEWLSVLAAFGSLLFCVLAYLWMRLAKQSADLVLENAKLASDVLGRLIDRLDDEADD